MNDKRDPDKVHLSEGASEFRKGIEIVTTHGPPPDWTPPTASLDPPPGGSGPSGDSDEG